MKALYIVLPILLFVALLLFSRVRIIFAYNGGIQLRISYLFVRIRLYPRNKRKPKKGKAKAEKKKTAMPADAPPPMAKKHTEKPKAKKKPQHSRQKERDCRILYAVRFSVNGDQRR